jgi:hypothetical protein
MRDNFSPTCGIKDTGTHKLGGRAARSLRRDAVAMRIDDATFKVGDDAVHGETAYAIGTEGE